MVGSMFRGYRAGIGVRRFGLRTEAFGLPLLVAGLSLPACVATPSTSGTDAGTGTLGQDAGSDSDPHAGHHSSSNETNSTGHDGTGHEGTAHDSDQDSPTHTGAHSSTQHSDSGEHASTSHGSETNHSGDVSHADESSHTGESHTSDHTTGESSTDHSTEHDTTEHDTTEHDTTQHDSSHTDTASPSDTTHEHSDSDATTDDGADASISDETDSSETSEPTHDHTDVDVSDDVPDASIVDDAGVDAAHHDHETSDDTASDGGVDAEATDTTTSTTHEHTATTTGVSGETGTSTSETTSNHTDHEEDPCIVGHAPEPSDALMGDGYDVYVETRDGEDYPDATIQTEAIEWMEQHYWQEAHFQWHQARRCPKTPTSDPNDIEICGYPEFVKQDNECENNANGLEFLAMHRHMIQTLKQLWPNHTEQFEGWDTFPTQSDYPDILQPYFVNWSNGVLSAANIANNIEDYVGMFPDEGAFGKWIQCGGLVNGTFWSNLHGALHFNGYSPDNQGHSVANQTRNLDAYLFWKLHGFIDKVWERYRVAKGLTNDLTPDVVEQCQEMHRLAELVESLWAPVDPDPDPDPDPEEVVESGYFHEVVRPFLEEARCRGCHGEDTPSAGLQLGFLTSTEIVEQLVNQPSRDAVGQTLVVPGEPEQSWLYMKISGQSVTASSVQCQASAAECHQAMPQGNGPMSEDAQEAIYQWIADGALPPTIEE